MPLGTASAYPLRVDTHTFAKAFFDDVVAIDSWGTDERYLATFGENAVTA